ncbi:hypothetical protein ACTXJ3_06510 [Brachybacterium paraconglomeratum]|uniref:hypothetical protein n=1 Tax=Brachybacterium paraconglomeratum TaxID=173362 RepID=UPI003FD27032
MPSETAPRTAHDLLDAILAPAGEVATDVLRPAVREHTREAYDALYRTPRVLSAPVLHALAVVTAAWQGSGALAARHRAEGADPSLAAADATADPALAALRDHVDLLSVSPDLVTQEDQQRLAEAGHDVTVVVLISQLLAVERHLQRLVTGLTVLAGLEVSGALAPSRALRARGRRAEHGGTTRTGRTRPAVYTREERISALIAIHDLNHAARYCDQIVVLHGGRLVADGSPAEALRAPVLRSVYEVDVEVDAREDAVEVRPRIDAAGFTRTGARLAELDEHGGIRADAVAAVPR